MVKASLILVAISVGIAAVLIDTKSYIKDDEANISINSQTNLIDFGNKIDEVSYLDVSNVTLRELYENPEKYKLYIVTINAIFGLPFEGNYIEDKTISRDISINRAVNGEDFYYNRIWLTPTDDMRLKYYDTCGLVGRLRGVFSIGPSGHLGVSDAKFTVHEVIEVRDEKAYPCGIGSEQSEYKG